MIEEARRVVDGPMTVRTEDFPTILAEYVGRFNRVFARLELELDDLRSRGDAEIELARAYSDILERQQACAKMVANMMQVAANLGVQVNPGPSEEEEAEAFLAAIRATQDLKELV